MIDTVKFQANFLLKNRKSLNWKSKSYRKDGKIQTRRFTHKHTGLKVISYRGNTYVETSLPKLLFGSNARLITSQKQIEKALSLADSIVREIGTPLSPQTRRFVRVDLAWQIQGRIDDLILALFQFQYPRIQKPTQIYMSETILWHSKELSISIYDKLRELKKWRTRNGDILRIEIRLKGKRLKTDFKTPSLKQLNFDQCYKVFREAVLKLSPVPLSKMSNQLSFYQLAAKYRWKIEGKPALQILTRELHPVYRKRVLKQAADTALMSYRINLRGQFPANRPHRVFRRKDISYSMPPCRLANFIVAFNKIRNTTRSN